MSDMGMTEQVVTYLDFDQVDVLNEVAEAKGISKASLIRLALAAYLGQNGYEFPGRTL